MKMIPYDDFMYNYQKDPDSPNLEAISTFFVGNVLFCLMRDERNPRDSEEVQDKLYFYM